MESKWSRIEQYLDVKTKEALEQKAFDKDKGRGYQIRYFAMPCRRPYASEKDYRAFASELDKIYGIGNASFTFKEKFTPFVNFDGINFHEGFAWTATDWLSAGFMLVESKYPTLTVNITKTLIQKKQSIEVEKME